MICLLYHSKTDTYGTIPWIEGRQLPQGWESISLVSDKDEARRLARRLVRSLILHDRQPIKV